MQYANGDRCQYLDITFRCRATGGEARVNDDESLEVGWFPAGRLPPLGEFALFRIKQAPHRGPRLVPAHPEHDLNPRLHGEGSCRLSRRLYPTVKVPVAPVNGVIFPSRFFASPWCTIR